MKSLRLWGHKRLPIWRPSSLMFFFIMQFFLPFIRHLNNINELGRCNFGLHRKPVLFQNNKHELSKYMAPYSLKEVFKSPLKLFYIKDINLRGILARSKASKVFILKKWREVWSQVTVPKIGRIWLEINFFWWDPTISED